MVARSGPGGWSLLAGVWIEPMMAWLGVRLPIKVLVNQLAVTERQRPVMRTVVGIASGLLSLKQYRHGTTVIGGGWQAVGNRDLGGHTLLPDRLTGNIRLACHAIPALKEARLARAWAGLEAETADALPAVGPVPGVPDAYVCGSVHSGYTSGLYLAKLLADRILGQEPALPLFPVDRLLTPEARAA
jgi:sarcosine oxidase, subunit beta